MAMSATKERLPYIDVAKGLLILMVVWGHFELILRETHKTSDPVVAYWDHVEIIWSAFFMPAFFFITGLCGNFNKPFKKFVIQSFRTGTYNMCVDNPGQVSDVGAFIHLDCEDNGEGCRIQTYWRMVYSDSLPLPYWSLGARQSSSLMASAVCLPYVLLPGAVSV